MHTYIYVISRTTTKKSIQSDTLIATIAKSECNSEKGSSNSEEGRKKKNLKIKNRGITENNQKADLSISVSIIALNINGLYTPKDRD